MNEQVIPARLGRYDLRSLVDELERQKKTRLDFCADSRELAVRHNADSNRLELIPSSGTAFEFLPGPAEINKIALKQLAERFLPAGSRFRSTFIEKFFEESPAHCADFLSRRMREDKPQRNLIRCLDGRVRACLSDRYRILDNYDVAFTALDVARLYDAKIIEASLSETHMRIKFTTHEVFDTINDVRMRGGHEWYSGQLGSAEHHERTGYMRGAPLPGGPGTVYPLVTISNSETGHGSHGLSIGVIMAICSNLMIFEQLVSQVHLGERLEAGIFSDGTRELESRTIVAKACDGIRAAFKPEIFKRLVAKANAAQSVEVTSATSAIENVMKGSTVLTETHRASLMDYFTRDYQSTAFGLAQAVSRLAQDETDPEIATEIEELAGSIVREPALVAVK